MTADTVGGVWSYALELAGALAPLEVEVHLATKGLRLTRDQRSALQQLSNVELHESELRLEWMEEPWEDVQRASEWLLELDAELRPDLIHLNDYAHGDLPFGAPALIVGHSCVLSWWAAVRGGEAPPEWDRYRSAVSSGLRHAAAVVAPSRAMLGALRHHYGELPNGRVIPNGRDPARFHSGLKEPFVLTAGRLWDEAKNVAELDAISGRLSWPVYVAGESEHPDGGRASTRSRCLGRLSAMTLAAYMARAPIFASPARYEPFGLSVLEAALSRCALVLGDIPSLRENWDGAALFVPPGQPDALANVLQALIDDAPSCAWMQEAALRRAQRFGPARMGEAYHALYAELARRGRATSAAPEVACAS